MLPPPLARRRGAIVLVHGAWVGEWSWTPVLPVLEASGRPVHAVSLTGHGARRHQSGPHVTQADHVADVVELVRSLDLIDITLVGHSYGGRVITAAYPHLADRIARAVYLDAHAPTAPDSGQSPERVAAAAAAGGMIEITEYVPDRRELGGDGAFAWFMERVMPQSFATFTEPIDGRLPGELAKTYVFATGYDNERFAGYAHGARESPDWDYVELAGSHWLMFTHPDEVAAVILG